MLIAFIFILRSFISAIISTALRYCNIRVVEGLTRCVGVRVVTGPFTDHKANSQLPPRAVCGAGIAKLTENDASKITLLIILPSEF